MIALPLMIPVSESSQVGEARRAANRVAEAAKFSVSECGEVSIIASELATNLHRYGRNGRMIIQPVAQTSGTVVEMVAVDSGPGMEDISRCMRDGYSRGGTAGNGLGSVRRLSTEFDIYSIPGKGTIVFSRVGPRQRGSAPPAGRFQWATVAAAAPHETLCGDAWRIHEREEELSILIADGLGHGPAASQAAECAAGLFESNPFIDPAAFMATAHRGLSGTRGAAGGAGHLSASAKILRYAGVGNIAGWILSADGSRGLFTHNGTLGMQAPTFKQMEYAWPDRGLLIMHSDGLQSRWSFENYPGLLFRHPAVIANVLYRDFVRGRDDVTVAVIRINAP